MYMTKKEYLIHREASKRFIRAFIDFLNVVDSMPKDTNITVKIMTKGGSVMDDLECEYIQVVPFLGTNVDDNYRKIWRKEGLRLGLCKPFPTPAEEDAILAEYNKRMEAGLGFCDPHPTE